MYAGSMISFVLSHDIILVAVYSVISLAIVSIVECGFYSIIISSLRYRFNYWLILFHFLISEQELILALLLVYGISTLNSNWIIIILYLISFIDLFIYILNSNIFTFSVYSLYLTFVTFSYINILGFLSFIVFLSQLSSGILSIILSFQYYLCYFIILHIYTSYLI